MVETAENRIKRLKIRSWRRGTKEMDLVLGPFSDTALAGLDATTLDLYEALLAENDQDLYVWFSGQTPAPEPHWPMLAVLRDFHGLPKIF